jgi:hypothetical protein
VPKVNFLTGIALGRHHSQARNSPWTMFLTGSFATNKLTAAPLQQQTTSKLFLTPQADPIRDGFYR